MKKKLAIVLSLVMGLSLMTACGEDTTSTEGTGTQAVTQAAASIDTSAVKLMTDGTLSVGVEVGYPPFEDFAEDGTTPIGYDIDIITEVAKRLDLKVNFINTAWDGIFAGIDKNYDVVCSACTITKERKETMIFSDPYINNYQSIVVAPENADKYKSFKDLEGKTIAVQKETTSDVLMSDYKSTGSVNVEIVANEKVTSCFTQLDNKEIDAVVVDSTVADGYVAKNADKYVISYKDEEEAEQFGIAMGKKSTALQTAINEALKAMEADGFIKETYDYWFGASTN